MKIPASLLSFVLLTLIYSHSLADNFTGPSVALPKDPSIAQPAIPNVEMNEEMSDTKGCRKKLSHHLQEPIIQIMKLEKIEDKAESKTLYHAHGKLSGSCLVSAAYFEKGSRKKTLRVKPTTLYSSFPFELQIEINKTPEIRLYNSAGMRATHMIEVENK